MQNVDFLHCYSRTKFNLQSWRCNLLCVQMGRKRPSCNHKLKESLKSTFKHSESGTCQIIIMPTHACLWRLVAGWIAFFRDDLAKFWQQFLVPNCQSIRGNSWTVRTHHSLSPITSACFNFFPITSVLCIYSTLQLRLGSVYM